MATSLTRKNGFGIILVLTLCVTAQADQPKLGFSGTLVKLSGDFSPLHGYHVNSVQEGTPAADIGLVRGDTVVFIGGTMAFTTREAYLYALRQQGDTTKIGVINGRTGKLVVSVCHLGHNPDPHGMEEVPDGVIMVDFAPTKRD